MSHKIDWGGGGGERWEIAIKERQLAESTKRSSMD